MIFLLREIEVVSKVWRLEAKDLIKGIRDIGYLINLKSSTPLIKDLRINQTFKDEAKKEEVSVTDLVLLVLWLLREDI